MLKIILIAVAVIIGGILLYAASKPDRFHVERRIVIAAPAERIQSLIDDFHQWRGWSPYENKDPAMQRDYSGATSGVGAIYAWNGNREIGAGRMEIRASSPQRIAIQLDFFKPFQSSCAAEFTIMPRNGANEVVWAMDGPSPYMSKLMSLFFNMDEMIGRDFETGLASLKSIAEH